MAADIHPEPAESIEHGSGALPPTAVAREVRIAFRRSPGLHHRHYSYSDYRFIFNYQYLQSHT